MILAAISAAIMFAGCEKDRNTTDATISVEENAVFLDADETSVTIGYSLTGAGQGNMVSAKSDSDWLEITDITETAVYAEAEVNENESGRTAVITLSYAGAKDVPVTLRQSGAGEKPNVTFDMQIVKEGDRYVIVNCTPSDPMATYIAMAVEKDDFDMHASDEEVFQSNMDYFVEWGMAFGAETEAEAIEMFLRKGAMKDYEITVSMPETDYYFYAYGMNSDGTITSESITKIPFRTTAPDMEDCTFDFAVRPSYDNIRINVTPSSIYVQYYWSVLPKAEFDAYGNNAQAIIDEIKNNLGEEEHLSEHLCYHNQAVNFTDLEDGQEYVVFAFGCDVTGIPTTDIMSESFTARKLEKSDCGFTLHRDNVRATSFAYEITPDDDNTMWFAYTLPAELLESYGSVEAMTDDVMDIVYQYDIDWTTENEFVHSGKEILCSYDMLSGELTPETNNIVVVFAVSEYGTMLNAPTTTNVTTAAADSRSDMTIDIQVQQLEDNIVRTTFIPSSKEVFFYDVIPKASYEEYGSDDACIAGLLSYYATNGLLSYKLSYDTASLESDSFTSGTEYIALAFGYDATISTGLFKKVFTAGEIEGTSSAAWRASLPQKRPGNPLQGKSLAEMLQARD